MALSLAELIGVGQATSGDYRHGLGLGATTIVTGQADLEPGDWGYQYAQTTKPGTTVFGRAQGRPPVARRTNITRMVSELEFLAGTPGVHPRVLAQKVWLARKALMGSAKWHWASYQTQRGAYDSYDDLVARLEAVERVLGVGDVSPKIMSQLFGMSGLGTYTGAAWGERFSPIEKLAQCIQGVLCNPKAFCCDQGTYFDDPYYYEEFPDFPAPGAPGGPPGGWPPLTDPIGTWGQPRTLVSQFDPRTRSVTGTRPRTITGTRPRTITGTARRTVTGSGPGIRVETVPRVAVLPAAMRARFQVAAGREDEPIVLRTGVPSATPTGVTAPYAAPYTPAPSPTTTAYTVGPRLPQPTPIPMARPSTAPLATASQTASGGGLVTLAHVQATQARPPVGGVSVTPAAGITFTAGGPSGSGIGGLGARRRGPRQSPALARLIAQLRLARLQARRARR